MLKDSPRLYPGSVDLIRRLHGRVKLAVVSGTWRENIQAVLEAAGLFDCFETVVGKEDVNGGQARAEAYELALKKLRIVGEVSRRNRGFAVRRGLGARSGPPRDRRRPSPSLR